MQYDSYIKRIEKVVSIFRFIFKHIWAIAITASACVAVTATLLAFKGTVIGGEVCPSEIVYGESLDYSAKAFLSRVEYEYFSEGEWSKDIPRTPGAYSVRAVAKATFGFARYGEEHEFKISPKTLTVSASGDSIVYGDSPKAVAGLIEGDIITDCEFLFSDFDSLTATATPNKSSIVIVDKDGSVVTDAYTIEVLPTRLVLEKRGISITVSDAESIYDGKPFKYEAYELSKRTPLAVGDNLVMTFDKSQTEVGSTQNTPSLKIFSPSGTDMTGYYNIDKQVGNLTVTKRPVTVTVAGGEYVYDGLTHSNPAYTIDADIPLAEGHTAEIVSLPSIKNSGNVSNALILKFLDKDGKDVTANYAPIYSYGTLTVTPRELGITTASRNDLVYSGETVTESAPAHVTGLVVGHRLDVTDSTEVINAGTYENRVTYRVLDENGNAVNPANYNISYTYGELKVAPRRIKITTSSYSAVYDGTEHTSTDYTVTDGEFVEGETVLVSYACALTNVGERKNELTLAVKRSSGESTDSNYEVSYEYGTLSVSEREIRIKPKNRSVVYSDEKILANAFEYVEGSATLVEGEELILDYVGGGTEVGSYTAQINVISLHKDGSDTPTLLSNYSVITEAGTIEIRPREVILLTESANREYDGTPLLSHVIKTAPTSTYGILTEKGHSAEAVFTNSITEVGEIGNEIDEEQTKVYKTDESGEKNDVSGNYSIIGYSVGTLRVTPRVITVKVPSEDWRYDGKEHSSYDLQLTSGALPAGESLSVKSYTKVTDTTWGRVSNDVDFNIYRGDVLPENLTTDNYEITVIDGTLEILPVYLTVTVPSATLTYDGKKHEMKEFSLSGSAAEGQTVVASHYETLRDVYRTEDGEVSSAENPLTVSVLEQIENGEPIDRSYNYVITYAERGRLRVLPLGITVVRASYDVLYDGLEHRAGGYTLVGALAEGEEERAIDVKTLRNVIRDRYGNVTSIANTMTVRIENAETFRDTTKNYEIEYTEATLKVSPIELTVTTEDLVFTYDGSSKPADRFTTDGTPAIGEEIVLTGYTTLTDVLREGTKPTNYQDILTVDVINSSTRTSVISNYEINYVRAALLVLPKAVNIKTYGCADVLIGGEYGRDAWVFDGNHHLIRDFRTEGLVEGHYVESGFSATSLYEYTPNAVDNVFTGVELIDTYGNYVTSNYDISWEYGKIKIDKREVEIVTDSLEVTYDGTDWRNTGYVVTGEYSFVSFHDVNIESTVVRNVCRDVPNVFSSIHITDNLYGYGDVTENYVITVTSGTLTVNPRPITVTPVSLKKVYDALPLYSCECFVDGEGLAYEDGRFHTLTATMTGESVITNVGVAENRIASLIITNRYGEDVTANYEIPAPAVGTLEVTKRPISIAPVYSEKYYDGTPLVPSELYVVNKAEEDYGLVEGQIITDAVYSGSITDFDSDGVDSHVTSVKILSADAHDAFDVTGNYEIDLSGHGTLYVIPRPITVVAESYEKVFDGTPLCGAGYSILLDGDSMGLAEGQYIATLAMTTSSYITEITSSNVRFDGYGTARNVIDVNSITIHDALGNSVLIGNYKITVSDGILTVMPRTLYISSYSAEKKYDGTPLYELGFTVDVPGLDFLDSLGHRVEVNGYSTATDVLRGASGDVLAIGNYHDYRVITDGGIDKSLCYDIVTDYGTLTVFPREITVTTESYSKVYDGTEYLPDGFIISGDGLADGEYAEAYGVTNLIFVTKDISGALSAIENLHGIEIFADSDNSSTGSNYDVSYVYGELKISPRRIRVTTGNGRWTYDAQEHSSASYSIEDEAVNALGPAIADTDSLRFISSTAVKHRTPDSGIDNIVVFEMTHELYGDVTDCYEVIYLAGKLKILPRALTVTAGSSSKHYDGSPLTSEKFDVTGGLAYPSGRYLADGEILANVFMTDESTLTAVGEAANVIDLSLLSVLDADGNDITDCYDITLVNGLLSVKKKPVTVETPTAERTYNGEWLIADELIFTDAEGEYALPDGHYYSVTMANKLKFVGSLPNTVVEGSFEIFNGLGERVTEFFEITLIEEGTITVTPRGEFLVITATAEKPYDGTPLSDATLDVKTVWGDLLPGDRIVLEDGASQTEVGTCENTGNIVVRNNLGEDVTAGYLISSKYGTLTVTEANTPPIEDPEDRIPILDASGNLGLDEGETKPSNTVLYYVYSDVTESYYLRLMSFGDYNGRGWDMATPYVKTPISGYSMSMLASSSLSKRGDTSELLKIVSLGKQYVLPTYTAIDEEPMPDVQTSDVLVTGDASNLYEVKAYAPKSLEGLKVPEELADDELVYRSFVYENYLTLDRETRAYMNSIIIDEGFDITSPGIIEEVAAFIAGSAKYSLEYDRALDSEENVAVAFLSENKEGICQHYATAATLLYRALGLPARYTTGIVARTEAGEWAEITARNAHAWVEVYISSIGWVQVEVTGNGSDGIPEDGGSTDGEINDNGTGSPAYDKEPGSLLGNDYVPEIEEAPDNRPKLIVQPHRVHKDRYDGLPVTYNRSTLYISSDFDYYLSLGYRYEFTVSGSQTTIGSSISTVSEFVIYDTSGTDVTEDFNIEFRTGTISVGDSLKIAIMTESGEYSGNTLTITPNHVWTEYQLDKTLENPNGYTLHITAVRISLTDAGEISAEDISNRVNAYFDYKITDKDGNDVTSIVSLIVDQTLVNNMPEFIISITRKTLSLKTASASKEYDEEPLTANGEGDVTITQGELINGHTLHYNIYASQTEVGSCENTLTVSDVFILDAEGNDVTANYEIESIICGTLTVTENDN